MPNNEKTICVLNRSIILHTLTFYFIEGRKQCYNVNLEKEKIVPAAGFQGCVSPYQTGYGKITCVHEFEFDISETIIQLELILNYIHVIPRTIDATSANKMFHFTNCMEC